MDGQKPGREASAEMTTQTAAPCKRHPDFQTSVSCGRCGDRVCPRCLVHAPVGVRCPDCGRAAVNPIFDVPLPMLLRAAAVGLGIALLGGGLFWIAPRLLTALAVPLNAETWRVVLISLAAILAAQGYLIGEAVSRVVNRKRGTKLKILSCVSMFVAFTLGSYFTGAGYNPIMLIGGLVGFYLAIRKF